jgi:hypothetical protein
MITKTIAFNIHSNYRSIFVFDEVSDRIENDLRIMILHKGHRIIKVKEVANLLRGTRIALLNHALQKHQ